jgi:hypothetical protein
VCGFLAFAILCATKYEVSAAAALFVGRTQTSQVQIPLQIKKMDRN